MAKITHIRPLQTGERIVDERGSVLPAFGLLWQQSFNNTKITHAAAAQAQSTASGALTGLDAKVDKTTQVIAGTGLTGGGPLSADVTLDVGLQALLNAISSTRGVILFRGASAWVALAPGTAGQVLTSGGAGADPHWV